MSYSNIKRCLSAALILAFASPGTYAISQGYSASPYTSAMPIASGVQLTDKNELITLSLRDSDVKQVLRMFADKVGMNIVFHNSVEGKVTLDLVQTPINEAFNLVLQIANLSYYKQGNTMIVMASSSPDNAAFSKQEMMVFPVNYVSASKIADFLNKNVFGMKKVGMSSVDAATVNPATNELIVFGMPSDAAIVTKVIEQFDKEPKLRTFAVNHTTPAEMANMICNMLLPAHGLDKGGESQSFGGNSGKDDEGYTGGAAELPSAGGGGIGSSDTIKLGEGTVACTVSGSGKGSAFDMQSLSIAYFPQRGTVSIMGGSDSQAHIIENFIKTNDIKQPQAMLEVSIVELNEAGSKDFQNRWYLGSKHWQVGFDGTSTIAGRPGGRAWTAKDEYIWDSGDGTGTPWASEFDVWGNATAYSIPQQVLRTVYEQVPYVHIQWMINYLIENRKARVLANPKILITNGKESVVDLTQDYLEKVTSEFLTSAIAGEGATGAVQKTYTIGSDLGIKVSLTPFISPEGYVTLNIKPDYSTIANQIYATGETGQRELVASLLSRRNLDLKNIRIKDGETLVIGGMIQEVETKSVNKIPLLGDLPLVGPAFRSTSSSKEKMELIIMITPKILTDGEEFSGTTTL